MKLQQVRSFLVVYQEKSVSAAAERLHATQSGLSMQMRELEESLGVQLFERSSRGVLPTLAGDRFYSHAVELVRNLRDAREELRSMMNTTLGSVRFGIIPSLSRAVLSRSLCEFTHAHPNVKLQVIEAYSAPLTESVAREDLDFAIVPTSRIDARINMEPVASDREFFVTGSPSARPNLDPVCISELGPLHLIKPSEGNARRARIDDYLQRTGATVTASLEMDAMMATLELIAVSKWTAILPSALCYSDLNGDKRCVHMLVEPELTVEYSLITPAAQKLSAAGRALADVIVGHIKAVISECEASVPSRAHTGRRT